MLNSWDFWDTLVTRCVNSPKDIFEIIEVYSGIKGFAAERVKAEIKSRVGVSETNIDKIYENLPYSPIDCERLKTLELDVEIKLASAINENISLLKENDLIISDMYLDKNTFLAIGKKCNLPIKPDQLFISSEYNKTKHEGSLFDIACYKEKIIQHCGDNLHSDVKIPSRKGIPSIYYTKGDLNNLEKRWLKSGIDGKYKSGLLRAARLANPSTGIKAIEWNIYCQYVAPVLVQFVEWILNDAQKRGIKKVYFLARDGQILHIIAKKIVSARNLDFDCRYFYASRHALHLPGHKSIDESKEWLLDNTNLLTLRVVAERSEIPLDIFTKIASRYLTVSIDHNLDPQERQKLYQILKDSDFLRAFNQITDNAFKLATLYFTKEGLLDKDNEPKAVVDVGWNARLQRSIENILKKNGIENSNIHGYYLGLSEKCVFNSSDHVSGFVYSPFDPQKVNQKWIDRYRGMIEFFLGADHPSTRSYDIRQDGSIAPVFFSSAKKDYSDILYRQTAINAYVDRYCNISELLNRNIRDEYGLALKMLNKFLEYPCLEEAKVFEQFKHTEQQVEKDFIPMVKKIKLIDIFSRGSMQTHGIWAEGSHRITGTLWYYSTRNKLKTYKNMIRFFLLNIKKV